MDGKGAWRDNVFVERLRRSVKYDEIYLRAYSAVGEVLERPLSGLYTGRKPHSSLDRKTPEHPYFDKLPQTAVA